MRAELDDTGGISYKKFYLRRIYRIFPPLYTVLVIALIFALAGLTKQDIWVSAVLAQVFHLTNYYLIYAGDSHILPNTTVLWSLAIEEHYYLLFPLLFSFLTGKMSYTRTAYVLIFLCVMVLLWRCYLVYGLGVSEIYVYMATDARIDSIIFGCIMGVIYNPVMDEGVPVSKRTEITALIVSFAVLIFSFLYRSQEFRDTFRYTLQGIALFPVFYLAIKRNNWVVFSWLNWKPIRAMGMISYTFYLSHTLVIGQVDKVVGGQIAERMVLSFLITVLFSALMYFLVEKKFSALRRKMHE
jgi:peptidoglycan/LPS O-acetylase OafA/YrhL